jgi:nucleotide-binding universal stress UspA family protein
MHYLVAADSIHTTAAACDYLDPRLDGPGVDTVTVLTVAESGDEPDVPGRPGDRDQGDAANVARARLAGRATVAAVAREGDPATAILDAVTERDVDVVILGPRSGEPGTDATLGSTARTVLSGTSVPAVIVPLAALDATSVE